MDCTLIVPMAADREEYLHSMPYIFNFSDEGVLYCIKAIQGLDLKKFRYVYFVTLRKLDDRYNLTELLQMQFRHLGIERAKVISLEEATKSQAETVYECIKREEITGSILIKDADGYFSCDFTETNGIVIFPLDRLDMVNPKNKSYVEVDDQFYITNVIEKKIISRYFNAGGYFFKDAGQFVSYYKRLCRYSRIYMSHIVYAMLMDNIVFRPFLAESYQDWGNKESYDYFKTRGV